MIAHRTSPVSARPPRLAYTFRPHAIGFPQLMDDRGKSFILVLPVNLAAGFGVKQPLQHMLKPLNSLCPGIAIGSGKPPTLHFGQARLERDAFFREIE